MTAENPPTDALFTREHEWLRIEGDVITIGITSFAQDALGDIVFVQLPALGSPVAAGTAFGEVESTKSVSDVYAPVAGTVVARNDALDATPELVNSDPYGEGWLLRVQMTDAGSLDKSAFLDSDAYTAHTAS